MSEAVTIIGIVSPAVVGIAGLWFGATREDRRLRWQTQVARLEALGDVLDEGGQVVTEALVAFDRQGASPPNERAGTGRTLDEKVEHVRLMDNRITIRLGPHDPASQKYTQARERLDGLSELVWKAHGESLDKTQAEDICAAVERAQKSFLEAAHEHALRADPET